MAVYGGEFDAQVLSPAQAAEVVAICAQIEASVVSVKSLAAVRAAEGKTWEHYGYRSPAEQLADQTGISPSQARRTLETGRRMAQQPEVARAALAGQLSPAQAEAVSDGVAADPSKAAALLEKAVNSSLPELNEAVAKVKADSTDLEERRKARHARRSFRKWTDRDGALDGRIYGHPEDGTVIWRMLDPVRRRLNMVRHQAGQSADNIDALDYDALSTIAAIALGKDAELTMSDLTGLGLFPQARSAPPRQASDAPSSLLDFLSPAGDDSSPAHPEESTQQKRGKKLAGSPLRVMVRVDLDALLRGVALEGELCEIPGYGPVPTSVVEDLIATENPFIIGVLTKGETVVGVYHHGRYPNAHQRSALDFLYPTCAVAGCNSRTGLQYDHRLDFAKTKITAFDLLDRLCRHHHNLKTRKNWALVDGRGKRAFVPPDDPRHPRHGTAPSAALRSKAPPPRAPASSSAAARPSVRRRAGDPANHQTIRFTDGAH